MRPWLNRTGAVTIALLVASPLLAQTNSEINAGIQFNFATPGARSLGLGGAFIGLADDATAAFTNPAGLTALTRPEISVEGRTFTYSTEFTDGGHDFGTPTGEGIDTIAGLTFRETDESTSGLSFASFVYPTKRLVFAAYRHELANFAASIETTGAFFGLAAPGLPVRFYPVRGATELQIVDYGASVAARLGDRFSIGVGVSFYDYSWAATTQRFDVGLSRAQYFGAPDFASSNMVNSQTIRGDDTATGFNVGLQWKALDRLTFGAVYRQGTSFNYETRNVGGPSRPASNGVEFDTDLGEFSVPDVYGAGMVFQPTDAFKVAFDWVRVNYSDLTGKVVNIFNDSPELQDTLVIDNGNEYHLGAEYTFLGMRTPMVLRAGVWQDPDHRMRSTAATDTLDGQGDSIQFRAGSDEMHYAAGFGILFADGKFELNAAYDTSEFVSTGSLSAIFRF